VPKLPDIPDIPGKSLIGGTTKRARLVAAAGAGAALAVGGVVAKRVLGHGAKDEGAKDDSANGAVDLAGAEADATVVPIAKEKAAPKPRPAKPKAAKPKPKAAPKSKPTPKPATAKAAPVTPKADEAKPPKPIAGTKPKPAVEKSKPDSEPHPVVGSESTSEPPLESDPEHPEGGRPPRRENLDQ
jgi:hypothetical protein